MPIPSISGQPIAPPLAMAFAPETEAAGRRVRVALVTNIPAPYRLPIYELLSQAPGIELKLFFCSGREPDRQWDLEQLRVPHVFLRERLVTWSSRYIHANPDVWARLHEFAPDVVITTGFNPTHLIAFAYAHARCARHVAMTDGTVASEARLSFVHRWVRRRVYRRTAAFVGAGEGSLALYRQYGLPEAALFKSHLCADNASFAAACGGTRDVDLIFCGRFAPGKLPLFAIAVAVATAQRMRRRIVLLLVGAGELEGPMREAVHAGTEWVDARFAGFARQSELPAHYARARVLLFPTLGDTWGVVANEACAAGVPVIVSPHAGVAGDLVREGDNGHVLPLRIELWAAAAARLLEDAEHWQRLSGRSVDLVREYTYANAAGGLAAAIGHATQTSTGDADVRRATTSPVAP